MNKYSETDKFVLSSSCKVVKGAKRSVLIDYQRTDVRTISNDYADLIEKIDRQSISSVKKDINESSHEQFEKFLTFLLSNEFGFITENLNSYPEISNELHDEHINLLDGIIEIHEERYSLDDFKKIINEFDDLLCSSIQLRILSKSNITFIKEVLSVFKKTNISYVEMHVKEGEKDKDIYHGLINDHTKLTEVFLYSCDKNETIEVVNEQEGHYQLSLGNIHCQTSSLDESICGIINFKDLTFGEFSMHNLLKNHNGCLYKKLTIDSYGNIKNCPSINQHFGHHSEVELKTIIKNKEFKFLGTIKKDEIEICKDCEFRYNCTDCRAFIKDSNNKYSKPLKCGYDPYTNTWEEWSENPLKSTVVEYGS